MMHYGNSLNALQISQNRDAANGIRRMASGVALPPALRKSGPTKLGPKNVSGTQRGSRQVTVSSNLVERTIEIRVEAILTNEGCFPSCLTSGPHFLHQGWDFKVLHEILVVIHPFGEAARERH